MSQFLVASAYSPNSVYKRATKCRSELPGIYDYKAQTRAVDANRDKYISSLNSFQHHAPDKAVNDIFDKVVEYRKLFNEAVGLTAGVLLKSGNAKLTESVAAKVLRTLSKRTGHRQLFAELRAVHPGLENSALTGIFALERLKNLYEANLESALEPRAQAPKPQKRSEGDSRSNQAMQPRMADTMFGSLGGLSRKASLAAVKGDVHDTGNAPVSDRRPGEGAKKVVAQLPKVEGKSLAQNVPVQMDLVKKLPPSEPLPQHDRVEPRYTLPSSTQLNAGASSWNHFFEKKANDAALSQEPVEKYFPITGRIKTMFKQAKHDGRKVTSQQATALMTELWKQHGDLLLLVPGLPWIDAKSNGSETMKAMRFLLSYVGDRRRDESLVDQARNNQGRQGKGFSLVDAEKIARLDLSKFM